MPLIIESSRKIEVPPREKCKVAQMMGLLVDADRGVNFPTMHAKDPNPLTVRCQFTDEAFGNCLFKRNECEKADEVFF